MATVAERLRLIRREKGMNQEQLGVILGVTRSAVSELERGDRRLSADELLKLVRALSISADYVIGLTEKPEVELLEAPDGKTQRKRIRISVPQKNVEKFKQALLYITSEVGARPNVGETVLYKLLYFMDFDYYEKYEEQMIGATYQKASYGPLPVEFETIVAKMIADGEIELHRRVYHEHEQKKYLPLQLPDLSVFSGQELEVIDDVIARIAHMGARQISNYAHKDVPWATAEDGEVIPYETVFYRTAAYSVREESGDD
jgi:transcriptional regulator with XRE-family HTH domain